MPPLSGKKPSEMKTTHWMLVYWLTEGRTRADFDALVQNMLTDWHIEGQVEQGETSDGKLHLQLYLKTPQTRGTRIAKFFPSTTIDEARNQFALQNYVHKEETRVAEFKTVENRSPQFKVVRDRFYEWYVETHADKLGLRVDDEEKLKYWDHFIGLSLEDGMEVDIIGINPQYRAIIMRWWTYMVRIALRKNPPVDNTPRVDKCLDKDKWQEVAPSSGIAELQGAADPVAEVVVPTLAEGGVPRVKKLVKVFLPRE